MARQKCVVIMPFGEKPDVDGKQLDFDKVYKYLIKPSVEAVDLDCVRSDEIGRPGWIHAEMIKNIYDADVALVDITTLNPNVFYELGVRHALRPCVTVLIRRSGTQTPFNIHGLNVIEYDPEDIESVEHAKQKIGTFMSAGIEGGRNDSLVHEVLDLDIGAEQKLAKGQISYELMNARGKRLCIIGGDIRRIRDVDVWVNSENTDMQMARFFDRSVSSIIRYLGAEKDELGRVTNDVVADELASKAGTMGVRAATIIPTTSGELARTHGVKKILHAAAVTGALGSGYTPIPNVADCVSEALATADSPRCRDDTGGPRSILFPLMGTGTARGDLELIVGPLLNRAIDYLEEHPNSTIERVCFVAWTESEKLACRTFLDQSSAVTRAVGSPG